MRAEPLVGAAADHVGAELGEVVAAVRRGVHGVDVHARADPACAAATIPARSGTVPTALDAAVTATHLVRSRQHRLDRARRQLQRPLDRLGEAHRRARALGRDHPRAHVGVVVQPRADDLVARRQRAHDGRREAHRQRREARAEDDAHGSPPSSVAHRRAGGLDQLVGLVRLLELPAVVGLGAGPHPVRHRLDGAVDDLAAGRPVEPGPALAQRGEAIAVHRSETSCARSMSCS